MSIQLCPLQLKLIKPLPPEIRSLVEESWYSEANKILLTVVLNFIANGEVTLVGEWMDWTC
jgi:hypothetical protein